MKLSKRGEYALRALIDLGIAHEVQRPLIQIGDLAAKERLPIKFLEQILMQLKEAQYIQSKRGKFGGYYLAMPAKKIKIGQVIRLIDGPLAPVACVSVMAYERCSCPDEEHCGLRMLMGNVRNAIANILDKFTLADTVEMTLKKIRRDKASIPFLDGLMSKPPLEMELIAPGTVKKTRPKAAVPAKKSAKPGVTRKPAVTGTGKKAPVAGRKPATLKVPSKKVRSHATGTGGDALKQ
jgi:Rrf2 family protein